MLPDLLKKASEFEGKIIMTKDTHGDDYPDTQEGKKLPVPHCVKGTAGWEFPEALEKIQKEKQAKVYEKSCFGSRELAEDIRRLYEEGKIDSVELTGLCTDICVVSNALLIKAAAPELPVSVDASCCAGVTPQKHEAALLPGYDREIEAYKAAVF